MNRKRCSPPSLWVTITVQRHVFISCSFLERSPTKVKTFMKDSSQAKKQMKFYALQDLLASHLLWWWSHHLMVSSTRIYLTDFILLHIENSSVCPQDESCCKTDGDVCGLTSKGVQQTLYRPVKQIYGFCSGPLKDLCSDPEPEPQPQRQLSHMSHQLPSLPRKSDFWATGDL